MYTFEIIQRPEGNINDPRLTNIDVVMVPGEVYSRPEQVESPDSGSGSYQLWTGERFERQGEPVNATLAYLGQLASSEGHIVSVYSKEVSDSGEVYFNGVVKSIIFKPATEEEGYAYQQTEILVASPLAEERLRIAKEKASRLRMDGATLPKDVEDLFKEVPDAAEMIFGDDRGLRGEESIKYWDTIGRGDDGFYDDIRKNGCSSCGNHTPGTCDGCA